MKIVFVGGGNMAGALIGGLVRGGHPAGSIHVVEVDPQRLAALQAQYGVAGSTAPGADLRGADAIVLAVKPQQMQAACAGCRDWLDSGFVLSIAAGIGADAVAAWCGRSRVVRAMPNTPALIGAGITGASARPGVPQADRALAQRILEVAGQVVWFQDESMLDAVTAVSGSGPAYVFFFIEALQTAARQMGMDEAQARTFSIATFLGAARLAAESTDPVRVLRERVTSKGGTTAAALAKLQADEVDRRFIEAVFAAQARSRELSQAFGAAPSPPG
jgi:pyrroline-5-carboxylate reductase